MDGIPMSRAERYRVRITREVCVDESDGHPNNSTFLYGPATLELEHQAGAPHHVCVVILRGV
jgi:hypothetical protein